MRRFAIAIALTSLAACSQGGGQANNAAAPAANEAATPAAAAPTKAPAGAYKLDLAHTSLNFRVSHLGLSHYTARFTKLDGELTFDPQAPEKMSVSVTIDPASMQTNYPDPAKLNFDSQVEKEFLETAKFPAMSFKSTKVETTGANTARVTGDLTLHGVTKPVTLDATFNGGFPAGGMDPSGARIGFSAKGAFKRSDFGIAYGVPAPGSNMGVGDEVAVAIESEFTQAAPAAPSAPPAG